MDEVEENLLECFLCTNKSSKLDLRQHIRDHHAIEKKHAIDKVYAMHFAGVAINTQTSVTWVNTMKNIGEALTRIEENSEENMDQQSDKNHMSVEKDLSHDSEGSLDFVLTANPIDLEEKLGIENMAKYIPEPLIIEDSELSMSLNHMLTDTTGIDEDDEPVIIKEKKFEYCDSNSVFLNNQETKNKNEEPIITLKHIDINICNSDPSSSHGFESLLSSEEQDEIIEELQEQEMLMVEESPLEEDVGKDWKPSDATLPTGWMINEFINKNDEVNMMYLSPCKKEFTSRDDISSFLVSKGRKITKTNGFKVLDTEKSKCNGLCEGKCRALIVPKSFYQLNDKNRNRKETKLLFIGDGDSKVVKIRDKFVKGVSKIKYVKQLKYDTARHRRFRPVIVFIEESSENQRMEKSITEIGKLQQCLEKSPEIKRNISKIKIKNQAKLEENLSINFDKTPTISVNEERTITSYDSGAKNNSHKKGIKPKARLSVALKIVDGSRVNEDHTIKDLLETDNDAIDNDPNEPKEKSMVEICTLSTPSPESFDSKVANSSQQEIEPVNEKPDKKLKPRSTKQNINIKTYLQELKDSSSKRRSLLTVNFSETETTTLPSKSNDKETLSLKEDSSKQIQMKKRQSLPAKLETPLANRRKSLKAGQSKENVMGLIDFDLVYKKDRTSSNKDSPKQSFGEKRKSLLDVFGKNEARSNKKHKKNESLSDEEIKKKNIAKLKKLQQKEVEVNKKEGTYVQCGNEKCLLWRLIKEYHDPSNVPDDWVCSMNSDMKNNVCGKGGQSELDDSDIVDLKYTCGSMVWGKMKGSPWWPGMVDFCPDSEEYYWIEEEINLTEPAWYHVVFFEGKGNQVSRAWIKSNDIMKMDTPVQVPKSSIKSGSTKTRLMNAVKMAKEAKIMTPEERLEQYSFAALFKGKWGEYSDIDSDTEEAPVKKKKLVRKLFNPSSDLLSLRTLSESPKGIIVEKHSKPNRKELVLKSSPDNTSNVSPTTKENDDTVQSNLNTRKKEEDIKRNQSKSPTKIANSPKETGTEDPEPSKLPQQDLTPNTIKKSEKVLSIRKDNTKKGNKNAKTETPRKSAEMNETIPDKTPTQSVSTAVIDSTLDHCYSKSDLGSPKKKTNSEAKYESAANVTTIIDDIKPEDLISNSNPNLDRHYPKPPLPSDVLIALAVRNLDPNNYYGASFTSIIAFLTLHFPYYNRNMEECKEMVRRAYDINTREETGKENFRIKGTLVEQLSVRIKSYVDRSRDLVKESMLIPEFLDTIVERFAHGILANSACSFRPPYSCKMLSYLALVSLCPPSSLEQIMIFITFLFPSLQNDKTAFKNEDFEIVLHNDEYIEEYYLASTGQTLYVLREGSYPIVLHSVRQFFSTKSNHDRLRKSIYAPEVVSILLPNLVTDNEQRDSEES